MVGQDVQSEEEASPEQLLIAIRATDDEALAGATAAVEATLAQPERAPGPATAVPLRTMGAGLAELLEAARQA